MKKMFLTALVVAALGAGLASAQTLDNAKALYSGSFVGQSDHVTKGKVYIKKSGNKSYVVLGEDFRFDGAPDAYIGFSKNDKYDKQTGFTKLKKKKGTQVYEIPAHINASNYDEVTIWCKKYAVPLGEAKLK